MFNICKRGSTSISRALTTARLAIPISTSRLSTPLVLDRAKYTPLTHTKCIHLTTRLRDASGTQAKEHHDVTKFQELEDLNMVHPNIIYEITQNMKLHTMTEVQIATINEALQGTDIIAQARTGTGKTLGFLIPTIQNILRRNPELASRKRYSRARASDIRAIIISPTRELAEQIAVEAEKLCRNTDLVVQVAVGGNSKRQMLLKTQRQGCHLLVATPGRLQDLLTDEHSGVTAPNLTTLVLDEADRLLDDGFSKDIEEIVKILPDRQRVDRQTLLFSATVPREVMHLVRRTLKPDFQFIQTVKEGELATHEKVPQNIVITPGIENWMPALVDMAKKSIAAEKASALSSNKTDVKPFKAIVYFSSTAQVQLAYEIIRGLKSQGDGRYYNHPLSPAELYIINGSMTQEGRTRAAQRFRSCRCGILFSTDVTARGMDFPGVSHVLQFGLPPNKEQYIHRVGRTGRGDKTGDGYIFIEKSSVGDAKRMLRGLPIVENKSIEAAQVDMSKEVELPADITETMSQVAASTALSSRQSKEAAYKSALNNVKSADNTLALARWAKIGWGFDAPPPISSLLANKLGLRNLPGVNIGAPTVFPDSPDSSRGYSSGSSGGYGSRGGFGARGGFGGRGSFGGRFEGQEENSMGYRKGFRIRSDDHSSFGSPNERSTFSNREDRGSFGNREHRGSFGNREDRGSFGNREGRSSFGSRGGRGGFSSRGGSSSRGSFSNREDRGSFSSREDRGGFDNREGRGSFGGRGGRGGYSSRGGSSSRGSFGSRGGRGSFGSR
ncbi:ATP-dependent RNA helicase mss116, mitochondrial [Golovinomyces cichoracearum]|uniref:ATP-dependent RNA helicase n=1 Tax=Golovinomyces cichoracearum TaxID=62708 RepID=A0A420HW45_9PEZI|nr:ATP-dependent RNA helicase mss116, mitochondrial [Golovinomyces cichoracearum]